MVTAYSPILKLALPVQGELSGTWGDVVNDNITSMVEQAIAGRAVIDTWTTNSHTLTTANGTTSESRCAMLELTDTGVALTGAGTVICPAASKIYIVKNAAGQNITVKTSAGTGILVPDGRTTFLFCDGTNVVEAMTHTTSLQLGTSTVVTAVLDEDNMASDSATSLATQQSIKAYVDAQVGANNELSEVLANGNTSGANDIIVDSGQKITTNTIDETTAGSGVTIDSVLLKDDVVNATDVETGSISANDGTTAATIANSTGVITVPSAVLTTADINGGTADGVVIGGTTPAAATATTVTANTSLNIAGTTTVTSILDEDNMASDDPAGLATQQSIKAYVDAQVGANNELSEVLANGNTTGGTDIAVSTGDDITFADNSKAIFGAGSDLQIYHDGSNSYVKDAGDGVLNVQGSSQVNIGGANGTIGVQFVEGANVSLRHNNVNKLTTTSTGIGVTGNATFADNGKAIFGAGSDLQIYHTGAHSYIDDTGTGNLYLNSNGAGTIITGASETQAQFFANGAVNLFYDNSQKLATTSTGIDVTGTVTAQNATFSDTVDDETQVAVVGGTQVLYLQAGAGVGGVKLSSNRYVPQQYITYDADMSFSIDNGTTKHLHIDYAGTSQIATNGINFTHNEGGGDYDFRVESDTNTHALFVDAGNNRVAVGTAGTNYTGSDFAVQGRTTFNNGVSTSGQNLIVDGYSASSDDNILVIGTQRSSGGPFIGYGLGQDGTNSYWSATYDNFSGAHSVLVLNGSTLEFLTDASNSQTAVGAEVTAYQRMALGRTEASFNGANSNTDFRVASDTNTHMLFVDAGANKVVFGSSGVPNINGSSPRVYDAIVDNGIAIGNGGFTHGFIGTGGTDGNVMIAANSYAANAGSSRYVYISGGTSGGGFGEIASFNRDTGIVFNEESAFASDFRVESDSNGSMFFIDASQNTVNINNNTAYANTTFLMNQTGDNKGLTLANTSRGTSRIDWELSGITNGGMSFLHNNNTARQNLLYMSRDEAVFNTGGENTDFRVASDTNTHALFVDAGNNNVEINATLTMLAFTGYNSNPNKSFSMGASNYTAVDVGRFYNYEKTVTGNAGGQSYEIYGGHRTGTSSSANYSLFKLNGATGGVTLNEDGLPNADFRVESDSNSNMFIVDAGLNRVKVGGNAISTGMVSIQKNVEEDTDIANTPSLVFRNRSLASGSGNIGGGIFFDTYRDVQDPCIAAGIWFNKQPTGGVANHADIIFGTSVQYGNNTDAPTERMRITAEGKILAGQTAQMPTFHATSTVQLSSPTQALSCTSSGNGSQSPVAVWRQNDVGFLLYFTYGATNTKVGDISATGTSTSYNTSSDYRLKTDAQPMTGASARVQALKPVNFEWIADGTRVDGFLAHEAQEVVPEAVTGTKDAVDADGNPDYQGIDQSKLVPLLTAALQEALTKIDALEARIAALENA